MTRLTLLGLVVLGEISMTGCSKPDFASLCLNKNVQTAAIDLVFDKAKQGSVGLTSNDNRMSVQAQSAAIDKLKSEGLLSFGEISMSKFDVATLTRSCSANIYYHVRLSDRTAQAKDAMKEFEGQGLMVPSDLFGTSPKSVVTFDVRPAADRQGVPVIEIGPEMNTPAYVVLLLETARLEKAFGLDMSHSNSD